MQPAWLCLRTFSGGSLLGSSLPPQVPLLLLAALLVALAEVFFPLVPVVLALLVLLVALAAALAAEGVVRLLLRLCRRPPS